MMTEHFFLKIEEIPFDTKLEIPTHQIRFCIRYAIQKLPSRPTTSSETVRVHLHSTVDSLRDNPTESKISLFQQSDCLGIDPTYRARLIKSIMSHVDVAMNSGSGLPSLLICQVLHVKIYHSLRFTKDKVEDVCCICLEEIDKYGARARCGHVFHGDCITKWLDKSNRCPLCWFAMNGDRYRIGPLKMDSWKDVRAIISKDLSRLRQIFVNK